MPQVYNRLSTDCQLSLQTLTYYPTVPCLVATTAVPPHYSADTQETCTCISMLTLVRTHHWVLVHEQQVFCRATQTIFGAAMLDLALIYLQQVLAERCSSTAAAMAAPSEVAVPLPSSSSATKLAGVARLSAAAVSASSTKKVDCPDMTSSLAPMRTKIASTGVRVREWAGTHAPTCAIKAARHT